MDFGDDGHRKGYCLYKLGCKGPETYANCPTIQFGDAGAGTWPVGCGHPCIGCTEQGVGFEKPIHAVAKLKNIEPSAFLPRIVEEKGVGASLGSAAVLAAVAGAAAGAGGDGRQESRPVAQGRADGRSEEVRRKSGGLR